MGHFLFSQKNLISILFVHTNYMSRTFAQDQTFDCHLDSFEKGRQFEEYVISLFNMQFFNLIEWRKSKRNNDSSQRINYSYPDLEITFGHYNNYRFAVECKWRKDMPSLSVWWANKEKIYAYEEFEDLYGIPVFIAIGLGGRPSKPQSLFTIPLYYINRIQTIHKTSLEKFSRQPQRRFYYDPRQMELF